MSITGRIKEDMTAAMKAGDRERAAALRMILSGLQLAAKEADGEFGEAEEAKVLAAEKKRRLQAAEAFREGGREERAAAEEEEARLIEEYLPQQLSEAELGEIVDAVIADTGAAGMKDMGRVMSEVMARAAGRADGKAASEMVRSRLAGGGS